jgi:phosphate uptake regulator
MESRKLIKSGPSSYVVSMPLHWIKKNKLDKGDILYLEERDNEIIYKRQNYVQEKRQFAIEVDDKEDSYIEKLLRSAYLRNYHTFVLKGKSVKTRIQDFRMILGKMVAVEILEQTTDNIIADEMLDTEKNVPSQILKRIDSIIRSEFLDLKESLGKDEIYKYIQERELDINRLQTLAQRILISYITNPGMQHTKNTFEIFMESKSINFLEMIGDALQEASMVSHKIHPDKDMIRLTEAIYGYYLQLMKILYTDDKDGAVALSTTMDGFVLKIDGYLKQKKDLVTFQYFMPMKRISLLINEMALIVLNKNT